MILSKSASHTESKNMFSMAPCSDAPRMNKYSNEVLVICFVTTPTSDSSQVIKHHHVCPFT